MNWPQHRIDALREMWPRLSAAQIAAELGEGLTRSAVIGMAHRLKLGAKMVLPRVCAVRAVRTTPFRRPKPLPEQPALPLAPLPDLPVEPVTFQQLTHKICHYPIGDAMPYLYCGRPSLETSAYCAPHHASTHYLPRSKFGATGQQGT